MNAEMCEFMAANDLIEVLPLFSDSEPYHMICGDYGPFEAGIPVRVPIWMALEFKRKHQCKIVTPKWMEVDELKQALNSETESDGLSKLPENFFEITRMLIRDARDDIFEVEAVKLLIQDIFDRRDAKLRTSAISFLSQNRTCHAQLDNVQCFEVARARGTLEACKKMAHLVQNKHDCTPL